MLDDSVTASYLAQFDRPILPLPQTDAERIVFDGSYLSRPMFLRAADRERLERDLAAIRSALGTLPDRVFGGDFRAFARAVGMTEDQIALTVRGDHGSAPRLTTFARADLYRDGSGFRLLELNLGSTVGGIDCVDMCRALLGIPDVADFVAREGLAFGETFEAVLSTLRAEAGVPRAGAGPVMALVETPSDFGDVEDLMRIRAARWNNRGVPTVVGHLGELDRAGGRLLLRGEPVDVVYRMFTFEDVLPHAGDGLLEPLLDAEAAGEVAVFTPLSSEIYGSKGALALLSEPSGRHGLTDAERDACVRLLPWTRLVRPGDTELDDGTVVDLVDHVLEHQHDLILKPTMSYGGQGVLLGADPDVTGTVWREAVLDAAGNDAHVVQRLVRPAPEMFPSEVRGGLEEWTILWGVFMTGDGYAGAITRGFPAEDRVRAVNRVSGALCGCTFHEPSAAHLP
ncbi:hypothetical protein [Pseudonocardia phyllosphaerae]|uniref:hypothetical protein n=1 Tax=Pseudonocardia phyllosphaerae TaxID=3390502 RepID=UPI00397C16C6